MPPTRDRDGFNRDAPRGGSESAGGKGKAGSEPADTTNLLIAGVVDSDDADVLRAVLTQVDEGHADVDDALGQLGADFFCEENGWRKLFVRLLAAPKQSAAFKRRALADYLQRLEAEREVDFGQDRTVPPRRGDVPAPLTRLVRGERTPVHFDVLPRIECRLGHCVLWVAPGSPPKLAITGQPSIPLEVGLTRIGRAPDNDVVLGERWPDVSRRHLVIEVTTTRDVLLTDTSSHGTLVTAAAL